MSESKVYQFGGVDWSTPSPERCAASDQMILDVAQSERPFQRIATNDLHARLSPIPDDLKIGWRPTLTE